MRLSQPIVRSRAGPKTFGAHNLCWIAWIHTDATYILHFTNRMLTSGYRHYHRRRPASRVGTVLQASFTRRSFMHLQDSGEPKSEIWWCRVNMAGKWCRHTANKNMSQLVTFWYILWLRIWGHEGGEAGAEDRVPHSTLFTVGDPRDKQTAKRCKEMQRVIHLLSWRGWRPLVAPPIWVCIKWTWYRQVIIRPVKNWKTVSCQ